MRCNYIKHEILWDAGFIMPYGEWKFIILLTYPWTLKIQHHLVKTNN